MLSSRDPHKWPTFDGQKLDPIDFHYMAKNIYILKWLIEHLYQHLTPLIRSSSMSCLSRSTQTSLFHWQICPGAICPLPASCHLLFRDANVACIGEALTWGDYDADVCGYRRHTGENSSAVRRAHIWMHTRTLKKALYHYALRCLLTQLWLLSLQANVIIWFDSTNLFDCDLGHFHMWH